MLQAKVVAAARKVQACRHCHTGHRVSETLSLPPPSPPSLSHRLPPWLIQLSMSLEWKYSSSGSKHRVCFITGLRTTSDPGRRHGPYRYTRFAAKASSWKSNLTQPFVTFSGHWSPLRLEGWEWAGGAGHGFWDQCTWVWILTPVHASMSPLCCLGVLKCKDTGAPLLSYCQDSVRKLSDQV